MTIFGRMIGAGLLLFPLLGGCGDDLENMPTREAVQKSLAAGTIMGDTKVGELYGGKAVLSSTGATWWVQGGKVYAVNGAAMELSPGVGKAPASVTAARVGEAAQGKGIPLPPHIGIGADALRDEVAGQLATLGMPPMQPSGADLVLYVGKDTVGQLGLQEAGGLVTRATVGVLMGAASDSPQRRPAVALLATSMLAALGNPADDVLDNLMRTAIAGDQEQAVVGDKVLRFRRDKAARMVEVEITPAGGK